MCVNPIVAVSICKNEGDKHVLNFLDREAIKRLDDLKFIYGADGVFLLPCCRCSECRQDYANEWAKRCTLESYMHKFNYFITLTYDEFHLPFNEYICKSDFTKFLKRLNYSICGSHERCKFFACVERGEMTGRLHLHAVLFLDNELTLSDPIKKGDFYHFHSSDISKAWSFGVHDITPFEHDCAAYVAKYASKQGKCFMSKNLAKSYYLTHKHEILADDFKIYVDFNKKNFTYIPDCFVNWFVNDDINEVNEFKLKQKDLQRLLMISKIQRLGFDSEYKFQVSKIRSFLKHQELIKERSDF